MVGQKTIEIDWKDFVRGMGTGSYTSDAGFSPGIDINGSTATRVNLTVNPGAISFPAAPTDRSTNLVGDMLMSCENPTVGGSNNGRLYVSSDVDQDGRFYSSGSTGILTSRGAEDTGAHYIAGRSDMIGFQGEAYVTNDHYIVRWQQPNSFDYTWGTFLNVFCPHPALSYEGSAYFGDANLLLRTSVAGTPPTAILTLQTNQVIVALGVDPGSGKMLISVVDQYDNSDSTYSQCRVLYYDGFSNKASKVVLTDDTILAFYNVGGTVFCTYGQNFGYWTGAGIQFLRRLNVGFDNTQLTYKHHITNIGEVIYIIEKANILAYGQVLGGASKAFWYAYGNAPSGILLNMNMIAYIGSNVLSFGYANAQFFTLDTSSIANKDSSAGFFSQTFNFERVIEFTQVIVQYISAIPANTDIGNISIINENNIVQTLDTIRNTQGGLTWVARSWGALELRSLTLEYIPLIALPVYRITIFYNEKD